MCRAIGFTSIVASRLSRCVYATDSDENALLLAKKNTERNRYVRPYMLSKMVNVIDTAVVVHREICDSACWTGKIAT